MSLFSLVRYHLTKCPSRVEIKEDIQHFSSYVQEYFNVPLEIVSMIRVIEHAVFSMSKAASTQNRCVYEIVETKM